jgi:hypothetical protein
MARLQRRLRDVALLIVAAAAAAAVVLSAVWKPHDSQVHCSASCAAVLGAKIFFAGESRETWARCGEIGRASARRSSVKFARAICWKAVCALAEVLDRLLRG